jgi:peptidase M1-like protein
MAVCALAAVPAGAQEGSVAGQAVASDTMAASVPAARPVTSDSVAAPATDFEGFFTSFLAQRPDSTRVAHVTRLTLERDAGRFTLSEGDLWLATPVGGRVCAAVFVGHGSFSLTPPTAGERERVRQVYGTPSMERRFRALVLVVADSTIAELERKLAFRTGTGPGIAALEPSLVFGPTRGSKAEATLLGECLRYVSDGRTREIKASLARPFLEGRSNGYFFSLIEGEDAARLFFEIDPQRYEDVMLWREPKYRRIGLWRVWRLDDVTMFPRAGGGDTLREGDVRPALVVKRHQIECRIAGDMDFAAVARMECESRDPSPQRWAMFSLYDRLKVDSVAWAAGPRARFFRGRDSDQLWVWCDPPLAPGETRTLRVHYRGRLIERVGDWMLIGSSTRWYPEPDGQRGAPFDLTFHSPSQYYLASVGERVSSDTLGQVTTSRWRSERPIRNASFVLGIFAEEPFGLPGAPEVTALMFRGKPDPIAVSFGSVRMMSGARMDRRVAADAARAVAFFSRKLGPPPASRIVVAELPDNGGEAFPGLVQITWSPAPIWGRARVAAEDAVFRAHEVAHQWWGYGVDYRTYRDKWLSEGFAEFAGLWYLREELGHLGSCLALLDAWREKIFEDLSFRLSDSPPAGPISLGYRSASAEVPGDHFLIVYMKGAWVLHMLRNLLLDLETGDDERFTSLMRDFYARNEGRAATTEEFRTVAERYAGEDLGWFFDQWVYGTDLPTYRFATRTDRLSDGKIRITCRVEQRGVPGSFRMPVPIAIDFGNGKVMRVRVLIQGATSEFELPLMERAPKAVRFNDLQSVLCRVENVKW